MNHLDDLKEKLKNGRLQSASTTKNGFLLLFVETSEDDFVYGITPNKITYDAKYIKPCVVSQTLFDSIKVDTDRLTYEIVPKDGYEVFKRRLDSITSTIRDLK